MHKITYSGFYYNVKYILVAVRYRRPAMINADSRQWLRLEWASPDTFVDLYIFSIGSMAASYELALARHFCVVLQPPEQNGDQTKEMSQRFSMCWMSLSSNGANIDLEMERFHEREECAEWSGVERVNWPWERPTFGKSGPLFAVAIHSYLLIASSLVIFGLIGKSLVFWYTWTRSISVSTTCDRKRFRRLLPSRRCSISIFASWSRRAFGWKICDSTRSTVGPVFWSNFSASS